MSNRSDSWTVLPEGVHIRLDQFIAERIPGESRSQIQNWIRKGYLLVNGEKTKTGYLTRLNDHISLQLPAPPDDQPHPDPIPLHILYEDSDLAVIDKPAGLVCHVGAGIRSGTLVNALLYHMGPLDTGDPSRPGIVHRLDKNTSGTMVVAKNKAAHRALSQQFKNRSVRKEYLALVFGNPSPAGGTVNIPLGRDPKNRKKISTTARHSRCAITNYIVEKQYLPFSLLRIHIETGRTHQIRVHLAYKGYPIVGDSVYGAKRRLDFPSDLAAIIKNLDRPFLHSHRLSFNHPRSGQRMTFTSPLPVELQDFLNRLSRQPASDRRQA